MPETPIVTDAATHPDQVVGANLTPDDLATIRQAATEWRDIPGVWAAQLIPVMADKIEQLRRDLALACDERDQARRTLEQTRKGITTITTARFRSAAQLTHDLECDAETWKEWDAR